LFATVWGEEERTGVIRAAIVGLVRWGSKGWAKVVSIPLPHTSSLTLCMVNAQPTVIGYPQGSTERAELEAFAAAIQSGVPYACPRDDAVHGVAVLKAIIKSARVLAVDDELRALMSRETPDAMGTSARRRGSRASRGSIGDGRHRLRGRARVLGALRGLAAGLLLAALAGDPVGAQSPPSAAERARYTGLLAAAARGDAVEITALVGRGETPDVRDPRGRTPLHVAAHGGHRAAMRALVAAGADPNVLEADRYDIVTIAAVADDLPTLEAALALGASARNVTSRYDGTALIAAAHLGHVDVVRALIRAGAPLDHVNNLGWTALIESIVLGDGGIRHTATLQALVDAGASVNLPDRSGRTPLALARGRGHEAMARRLEQAGAR
jgi:hypothetical protein